MTETKKTQKITTYPTFEELAELFLSSYNWQDSSTPVAEGNAGLLLNWLKIGDKEHLIKYLDYRRNQVWHYPYEKSVDEFFRKHVNGALNDADNTAAQEFLDNLRLILCVRTLGYYGQYSEIKLLAKKTFEELLKMPDNEVKYEVLYACGNRYGFKTEIKKVALKYCTKQKVNHIAAFIHLCELYPDGSPERLEIFKDAEVRVNEFIDEELKKKIPDVEGVEYMVKGIKKVASFTCDKSIMKIIDDKYDIDKIIKTTLNTDYVANIQNSITTELVQQKKENEELKHNVRQIRAENAEKDKELSHVRSEKAALERELEELRQSVINLHAESENMQPSLLSRGVKRVKDKIYELELMARAKEERTK